MIAGLMAGVIAGSIAAIVASLVSLPLRSPVDSVFNTATITLASLVVGILSGLIWAALSANRRRMLVFDAILAVAFIGVVVIAAIGNSVLDRLASFTIPLAAIVFVLAGVLIPSMRGLSPGASRALAVILLIAAVILGVVLMGQGDTESGELSLPERVESPTPVATQAPVSTMTTESAAEMPTEVAAVSPTATQPPAPAVTDTTEAVAPADIADTPQVEQADNTPIRQTDTPGATQAAAPEVGTGTYVVGEGSEITFTVGEELARSPGRIEAVLRSTDLSGQINIDGEPSTIEVDLHSLSSDQQYRDRYVRSRMFPNDPIASFRVDSVEDLPPEFHNGDTFQRPVSGTLRLKGNDFPLTFDLEVRNDGNILNVLGRTVFTWEQLEVPVPTARSVVSIEDDIHVQILLIAEQQ